MEGLWRGSTAPTQLERGSPHRIHPVQHSGSKGHPGKALQIDGCHPHLLRVLGQQAHRARELRGQWGYAHERPTRRHPQCSKPPPHMPSNRCQTLHRPLRVLRKDQAPRATSHRGYAPTRRPQFLLHPRGHSVRRGGEERGIELVHPSSPRHIRVFPI